MSNYKCVRCGYTTNIRTRMITHNNRKNICKSLSYKCQFCNKQFIREKNLNNHINNLCPILMYKNSIYKLDKQNKTYIYIIQSGFETKNIFKIGKTNNLKKTLGQIRCQEKFEPYLKIV